MTLRNSGSNLLGHPNKKGRILLSDIHYDSSSWMYFPQRVEQSDLVHHSILIHCAACVEGRNNRLPDRLQSVVCNVAEGLYCITQADDEVAFYLFWLPVLFARKLGGEGDMIENVRKSLSDEHFVEAL